MLKEMDNMEATYVFYVQVGRFDRFEQSKISVQTVMSLRIVMPTSHSSFIVSV
jgi:hypothetical protein